MEFAIGFLGLDSVLASRVLVWFFFFSFFYCFLGLAANAFELVSLRRQIYAVKNFLLV